MAKITLNTITSSFSATSLFNTNFASIATEINDNVLYRDGVGANANQMEVDLDMNSNDILNCDDLTATTITLNGTPISPTPVTVTALAVTYDNTTSGLTAATVQAALDERVVDFDAHIVDAVDAHDASAISNVASGNLAATEVQAALNELQTDIDNRLFNDQADTMNGNLTITSTLLDVDNSSDGAVTDFKIRNSEGGGNISINAGSVNIGTTDSAGANFEEGLTLRRDAAAELYNDNVKKFETMGTGTTTFGTQLLLDNTAAATLTRFDLRNSEGGFLIFTDGGNTKLQTTDNAGNLSENALVANRDAAVELYHNNIKKLETTSTGTLTTGTLIKGTNSGATPFDCIYHNSEGGYQMRADTAQVILSTTDGSGASSIPNIIYTRNGSVDLKHNNATKFETTSTGVTVTGAISTTGQIAISTGDATAAILAARNTEGGTALTSDGGDTFLFQTSNTGALEDVFLKGNKNGSVELRHNDINKFETTSTGVKITGTVTIDGEPLIFNEVRAAATTDYLAIGHAISATTGKFSIPLNHATTAPTSIGLTGTMDVVNTAGGSEITAATPSISNDSSPAMLVVNVGSMSGLTTGERLILIANSTSSKIKAIFP